MADFYYKNNDSFLQISTKDFNAAATSHSHTEKVDIDLSTTERGQLYAKLSDGTQTMINIALPEDLDTSESSTAVGQYVFNGNSLCVNNTVKKILLKRLYPVGSVYMSWNSTSPASLFGGTWVEITESFPYFKSSDDDPDGWEIHYHWQTFGKIAGWEVSNNKHGSYGQQVVRGMYIVNGSSDILEEFTNSEKDPFFGGLSTNTRVVRGSCGFFNYNTTLFARTDTSWGRPVSNYLFENGTYFAESKPPYQTVYAWRRTE